jgi:hypothetical protein
MIPSISQASALVDGNGWSRWLFFSLPRSIIAKGIVVKKKRNITLIDCLFYFHIHNLTWSRKCNTNRLSLEENRRHQRCISCRREFSLLPMATPRREEPAERDLTGLAAGAEKDPPVTAEYPARAEQDPMAAAVFLAWAESDPTALAARPETSDWDPADRAAAGL